MAPVDRLADLLVSHAADGFKPILLLLKNLVEIAALLLAVASVKADLPHAPHRMFSDHLGRQGRARWGTIGFEGRGVRKRLKVISRESVSVEHKMESADALGLHSQGSFNTGSPDAMSCQSRPRWPV